MLKFITVIVICYFGKLENNKSSIFGPATIYPRPAAIYPRPATRDTRRLDYLHKSWQNTNGVMCAHISSQWKRCKYVIHV